MATLNAPKIPYRPKWPNDTQMSAAGVKIEEAKRTGNWDMITKDEITWALLWEVMIVAEEQTALPPAEKLESAQAFRALVNKTADDWFQETIASVPVNRVKLRAHLHERLPYYRWRVETYGAVLAGPYVYADPPLPEREGIKRAVLKYAGRHAVIQTKLSDSPGPSISLDLAALQIGSQTQSEANFADNSSESSR